MVGVGSTLFHLTLRYKNLFWIKLCKFTCRHSMQVLDEVPMIWGSCFMVYTMEGVGALTITFFPSLFFPGMLLSCILVALFLVLHVKIQFCFISGSINII